MNQSLFRRGSWSPVHPIAGCLVVIGALMGTGAFAEMTTREGTHLRLTSDVADAATLDDLVDAFDQAVPQWMAFWGLPVDRIEGWKIDGYLMGDAQSFRSSGQLPAQVPVFQFGFATPQAIWVHYQPTIYYNRHLILHEGVHALAFGLFGGGGPSWYMEGTAELLATHRDRSIEPDPDGTAFLAQTTQRFRVNDLPRNRDESPLWGRYRVVQQRRDAGTLPSLASVLKLPMNLAGDVESYTWCWAAAMMFTTYPDTRDHFIESAADGRDSSSAFTAQFFRGVQDRWPVLRARWQMWLHDLEYGFDPQLSRIDVSVADARYDGRPLSMAIDSADGWQSAGVWFPKDSQLRIGARGRCVIVDAKSISPQTDEEVNAADWQSEPAGITVKYHRGRPIGQLQICVLPIPDQDALAVANPDIQSWTASSPTETQDIRINRPSWLLFRVNDLPGREGRYQRNDNHGGYEVAIRSNR